MKIVNYSNYIEEIPELNVLLSKLELSTFADECRYKLSNFGRRFCCIFLTGEQFSKECCWPIKDLSMLTDNISILEGKSKVIDNSFNE